MDRVKECARDRNRSEVNRVIFQTGASRAISYGSDLVKFTVQSEQK